MMTILIVSAVLLFMAVLVFVVCVAAALLSVGVVQQHENGVAFRLGKVQDPARQPALTLLKPVVDRMTKLNVQVMTLRVPAQECITKDNVSVRVDAVVFFRVVDPVKATANVPDSQLAISQLAQTSLHTVIGNADLDDLRSAQTNPQTPTGPQDAPQWELTDAARGPQDATGAPQDAAQADLTIAQVEESVDPLDTRSHGTAELLDVSARGGFGPDQLSSESSSTTSTTGSRVAADLASSIAVAKSRGATKALREFAAGRRLPFVMFGRDDRSKVPAGDLMRERAAAIERAIIDSVPRPVGGPAYLGRRDDTAYLRGWDDAVDWIRQGNQERAPSWSSAAYMTGWNDAARAIARVRRGS